MSAFTDELEIRPADSGDVAALAELYRHLNPDDTEAPEALRKQTFDRMLKHPGLTVLLGCKCGRAVSTCTLIVVPNLTRGGAPYALIENVVTLGDRRGTGIGRQVVSAALEQARAEGCYKIMLMSGAGNTDAHRFYERIGFARTKVGFEIRAEEYPAKGSVPG
ncbi:GNAT family N-acetyltransferase [Roseibium salinum]|uniref:GNAT family N-acetyltransferase n=1 Tax=Roseibium salinum TaxID=1604349 RepID=A0ABT3R118_9HYPH|nr:GNAT family N-acetyltransferase [Roseibium sp. DSM 29163]MCX2722821.1 GNAT family N-acetyltransferase [Roseibium sp. DSM 29163]